METEKGDGAFESALFVVVSILGTVTVLSGVNTLIEYLYPSYSGLPFWYPLQIAPVDAAIGIVFALAIELVAKFFRRRIAGGRLRLVVFGCVCGFTPLSGLADRFIYAMFETAAHSELISMILVFFLATGIRCWHSQSDA